MDASAVGLVIEQADAALRRGDPRAAQALLIAADADQPGRLEIKLQLALALRLSGALTQALVVLDEALALDPYSFLALLSKATILERLALPRAAAAVYRDALALCPTADELPRGLIAPVEQARRAVEEDARALQAFVAAQAPPAEAFDDPCIRTRFEVAMKVICGQMPSDNPAMLLKYPGLAERPFLDRSRFAWLPRLEAATDMIRDELLALLARGEGALSPYIALPTGAPVNQWERLNHSRDWTSFWLWKDGAPQQKAQALCPRTCSLLAGLPMMDQPGFAPTAVFSVLEPHAHIPPHTGSTNVRLLVHLPLILPGPARLRVAGETRSWAMNEAWVFDDSLEHEAWNDAHQTRVILIFDIWHPDLTSAERTGITMLLAARKAYYAAEPPPVGSV